jgi:hypothetical protein
MSSRSSAKTTVGTSHVAFANDREQPLEGLPDAVLAMLDQVEQSHSHEPGSSSANQQPKTRVSSSGTVQPPRNVLQLDGTLPGANLQYGEP